MIAMYGHKWTSVHGEDARRGSGPVWAAALAGCTEQDIARGLAACIEREDAWPPTAPEFRALCVSTGAQFEPAFAELSRWAASQQARAEFAWTQPHAFAMSHIVDRRLIHMGTTTEARRKAFEAFEQVEERARRGEDLTLPQVERITKQHISAKPEVARAALDELAAKLGVHTK